VVSVGGGQQHQQPYSEQLYQLTGSLSAPITLSPTLPLGAAATTGTAQQATATWFEAADVPTGSWPVSLTAQAVTAAIQGSLSVSDGGLALSTAEAIAANTPGSVATIATGLVTNSTADVTPGVVYNVSSAAAVMFSVYAYKTNPTGAPTPRTLTITWYVNGVLASTDSCVFIDTDVNDSLAKASHYWVATRGNGVSFSLSAPALSLTTQYALLGTSQPPSDRDAYYSGARYWEAVGMGAAGLKLSGDDGITYALCPAGIVTVVGYPNTRGGSFTLVTSTPDASGNSIKITITDILGSLVLYSWDYSTPGRLSVSGVLPRRPVSVTYKVTAGYPSVTTPLTITQ
jgi:hypothetical protein